jgi:hypothetical protein
MPVPDAPGPRSMRRRLADDTDDDDDNNPRSAGKGGRTAEDVREECVRTREADGVQKADERAVQAQKKRARKEMLDSLARKRGGEREESEEEEERGRRPNRRNERDTPGASDETRVEVEEGVVGTQQGKRRRLLKTDVVAEEEAPVGLEEELLEDVEVPKAQVAARGRRQVLMDSDDED